MTLTIGWWAIPVAITLLVIFGMFVADPYTPNDQFGIGAAVRFFMGLIILLVVWLIYFMVF